MPDKPTWCGHLDDIVRRLREMPDSWVDRSTVEELLGVRRRRAQQVLAPCVSRHIGANGVADRETVIAHLQRLAAGELVHYEHQRRRRFAERMDTLYRDRRRGVLVEAPLSVVNRELDGLPEGITITPGLITVRFETSKEALEKLLALAMAIGNDQSLFERLATGTR